RGARGEFLLNIGSAVDRGEDELGAVELLGGELRADRGRVVDGEHGVDLVEAGEQRLEYFQAAVAPAFGVLIIGQDLDVRVLPQHVLAALDALQDRRRGRSV